MTQTLAIFLDAYRDLNSRKLFWLSIFISFVVVAVVAALGIDEQGVTVLGWRFPSKFVNTLFFPPETYYKLIFQSLRIDIWLTWLAAILALVSTAGIIPDMIAGGSIDMMLSKPIGRTRLFLTRRVPPSRCRRPRRRSRARRPRADRAGGSHRGPGRLRHRAPGHRSERVLGLPPECFELPRALLDAARAGISLSPPSS